MELFKTTHSWRRYCLKQSCIKSWWFFESPNRSTIFKAIGKEIADRYRDAGVQRIVTIEASGIALALMAALELDVPLVFARKKKSILMVDDVYHSVVYSYTKEENYDITISKKFLPAGEKVLIIDDFLASGEAAMGLAKLVKDAGDEVVGMAIAIEKSFQPGRERLENAGFRVESLVRIKEFKIINVFL